jgi:hypothetical protein
MFVYLWLSQELVVVVAKGWRSERRERAAENAQNECVC